MKKRIVLFMIASTCLFGAITDVYGGPAQEIMVSAAMSLKNAFEDAGKEFEARNKEIKVVFNFGASGDLARQIEGGALVDVFASASSKDMSSLEKTGFILASSKKTFAQNAVVLIVPAKAEKANTVFSGLATNTFKRIVICNPRTSPAGKYAVEVLQYYKIFDAVAEKLVYAENVRQALDYVARGEADAGVVFATDALLRQQEVRTIAVAPEPSHKPVLYPLAIVTGTKNAKAAESFLSFVTSAAGKSILLKHGFKPVGTQK